MLIVNAEKTAAVVSENIIDFTILRPRDKDCSLHASGILEDYDIIIEVGTETEVRQALDKIIQGFENNARVVYL